MIVNDRRGNQPNTDTPTITPPPKEHTYYGYLGRLPRHRLPRREADMLAVAVSSVSGRALSDFQSEKSTKVIVLVGVRLKARSQGAHKEPHVMCMYM